MANDALPWWKTSVAKTEQYLSYSNEDIDDYMEPPEDDQQKISHLSDQENYTEGIINRNILCRRLSVNIRYHTQDSHTLFVKLTSPMICRHVIINM